MTYEMTPDRLLRCFQRVSNNFGTTSRRPQSFGSIVNARLAATATGRTSSASRAGIISLVSPPLPIYKLHQVDLHVRRPSSKSFATARQSSSSAKEARVLCETREHSPGHNVTTLSISNPSKLNIVNSPLLDELIQTCQEIAKDDALRAVILTGAPTATGKAASFIGGADIREMSQISSYDEAKVFITRVHNACAALRDIPVPVIGRVHGFALGAGLEILASVDMRIGTKDSTFGMPEVKIGLPSVVEAAYFPGLIGWGRTRRLLYLAENIKGPEAEKWGLIEKLVDDEAALDRAVSEWVDMLVSMGPKCIRDQKRLMQKWENSTVDEGIEAGVEALAEAFRDGGREPKKLMANFTNRKR